MPTQPDPKTPHPLVHLSRADVRVRIGPPPPSRSSGLGRPLSPFKTEAPALGCAAQAMQTPSLLRCGYQGSLLPACCWPEPGHRRTPYPPRPARFISVVPFIQIARGVPSQELGGPSGKGCSLQTRLRALGPEQDGGGHRSQVARAALPSSCDPRGAVAARCPRLLCPSRGHGGQAAPAGCRLPCAPCAPTAGPPSPAGHIPFPVPPPGSGEGSVLPPALQRGRQDGEEPSSCLQPNIAPTRAAPVGSNTSLFPSSAPGASLGGAAPPRVYVHVRLIHGKLLQSNTY